MNLNKYSLSTRLLLSYALLFLLSAVVGGFATLNMSRMMATTIDIKDVKMPVIQGVFEAEVLVNEFRRFELLHIIETDPKEMLALVERMKASNDKITEKVAALDKITIIEENKKSITEFRGAWAKFLELHKSVEALSSENKQKEAQSIVVGDSLKAMREATDKLKEIRERSLAASKVSGENAQHAYDNARNVTFVVLGFAFAATVALTIYGNRTISRPLDQVAQTLSSASSETGAASGQLTSTSQTLANVAARGASSLEETAASLREIEKATNENVTRTEGVSKLAGEVRGKAESGNASMERLVEAMGEILVANDKIQELVKVIEEIGEKTEIIDEIVFQTKLLSFNASVEAERAGEHGRGFAVVAQEVGNLATMSGKAALEISNIVKTSIKAAENVAVENRRKVTQGDGLVKETSVILQQINQAAGQVLDSAGEILQISRQSSNSIAQINTAVTHLDRDTQSMSANAEESAAAAAELDAQAASLARIVTQLREFVNGQGAPQGAFGFDSSTAQAPSVGARPARAHAPHGNETSRSGNVVPMSRKVPTTAAQAHAPAPREFKMQKAAGAENDGWEEV